MMKFKFNYLGKMLIVVTVMAWLGLLQMEEFRHIAINGTVVLLIH